MKAKVSIVSPSPVPQMAAELPVGTVYVDNDGDIMLRGEMAGDPRYVRIGVTGSLRGGVIGRIYQNDVANRDVVAILGTLEVTVED